MTVLATRLGILNDILLWKSEDIPKLDPHDVRFKMPNEFDPRANPVRNLGKVQKFLVGADFEAYAEQLETEKDRPAN